MKKVLAAMAVLSLVAGVGYGATTTTTKQPEATSSASLKQGTQEIVVGGLFNPESAQGQATALSLRYGQFIQDNIEVGGVGSLQDDDLGTIYDVGVFAEYNFDLGTPLVPFVGVAGSYMSQDIQNNDINDALVGTVSAGVKYFLASNVSIRLAANGYLASDDVFARNDTLKDNSYDFTLGMAFYIP